MCNLDLFNSSKKIWQKSELGYSPPKPSIWLCPCMAFGFASVHEIGLVMEQQVWNVPKWFVFFDTFPHFGSSVCGIAYGALSTSMDPNKKGSFPGFEQVQKNWVLERRRRGQELMGMRKDMITTRACAFLSFPFLSSSSSLFDFSSTPMELIANSVWFFFVFLSNKIRKCSVFVLIGTC